MILRDILVELHVTSTNSHNNLILLDADNGLCGTNQEDVATGFGSNYWNCHIQSLYFVKDCSIKFDYGFVTLCLWDERNWSSVITVEQLVTLYQEVLIMLSEMVEVNFAPVRKVFSIVI